MGMPAGRGWRMGWWRALVVAIAGLAMAGAARAAPEGFLGWKWGGTYYPTATDACRAQWIAVGMDNGFSRFIGADPDDKYFTAADCRWTSYQYLCRQETGAGFACGTALPAGVSFFCASGYLRVRDGECARIEIREQNPCGPQGGPTVGNPILLSTGAKLEQVSDFATADGAFVIGRHYRSTPQLLGSANESPGPLYTAPLGHISGWAFDFAIEWHISRDIASGKGGTVHLPSGVAYHFSRSGNGFVPAGSGPTTDFAIAFVGTPPSDWSTVTAAPTQWRLTDRATGDEWLFRTFAFNPNAARAVYSVGRPVHLQRKDGHAFDFAYGPMGELVSITDGFGRSAAVTWRHYRRTALANIAGSLPVPEAIAAIALPDGTSLHYSYDPPEAAPSTGVARRLVKVERLSPANVVVETTRYHYEDADFPSRLTGITDNRGIRFSTYAYDRLGRATSSEHAGGAERVSVAYAMAGTRLVRNVTNAAGKVTVYGFAKGAASGQYFLTTVDGQASANCAASQASVTYQNNVVSTETDAEGRVTAYVRDALGRPLSVIRGAGTPGAETIAYTWEAEWSAPTRIVRPGLTIDITRNAGGQVTAITATDTTTHSQPYATNGQTRTLAYTYGPAGQLLAIDGPLAGPGDTERFTYFADGSVKTYTDALGQVTTVNAVNGRGQPTGITDANGAVTSLTWDDLGRLTSFAAGSGAGQAVTSLSYDGAGDIIQITRPDGAILQFAYDDARRLVSLANGAGEAVDYSRDALGAATSITVRRGSAIVAQRSQVFDELGRLSRTVGAFGQTWRFAYDRTDNPVSISDPRAKAWTFGFDALNRLVSQGEPGNGDVVMTRDAGDAVTEYRDRRALVTTYVRNGFGEVIRADNPDSGITDYERDSRGLATRIIDGRGVVAVQSFDAAGRLTARTYPSFPAENVTLSYDSVAGGNFGRGRLTAITDEAGTSSFRYDSRGNLLSETRSIGATAYVVAYGWTLADRLASITYPSGRVITYQRDGQGRIIAVTAMANQAVATLASAVLWQPMAGDDAFGAGNLATATQLQALPGTAGLGGAALLRSLTYGNGLELRKTFTADNEVARIVVDKGGTTIVDLSLSRLDATHVDRLADAVSPANDQALTYDDAGRLASASGGYGTRSWTYDANGNRLTETANGAADAYAYPAQSNRLGEVRQGTTVRRAFTYDGAGHVTRDLRGATAFDYAINAAGRISELRIGAVLSARWTHDGMDRLRIKETPAAATHYVWDAFGHIIAEHDGTGAPLRDYVWLGDTPLALYDGTTAYFVHPDALDRPAAFTLATGPTLAWRTDYDPFGVAVTTTAPATDIMRLPGQWYQAEDGLAYNWHRSYDASLGRYSQPDRLGFVDGPSLYGYAGQSPLMRVDPEGDCPWCVGIAVGAGTEILLQGIGIWRSGGDYTNLSCYNWLEVGLAGALGALGGEIWSPALKLTKGSSHYKNVSKRLHRYNIFPYEVDFHHAFLPRRWENVLGEFSRRIVNHPANLKALERNFHQKLHRGGYLRDYLAGLPRWSYGAGAAAGAGAGAEIFDGD